jgi:CheY-like chemotaxis protein
MRSSGDDVRVDLDALADADDDDAEPPSHFAVGSEVHDCDALLAGYLLEYAAPPTTDVPRVLVVSGDETSAVVLAEMLREAGYLVLCARTPGEAIRVLSREHADVVIAEMDAVQRAAVRLHAVLEVARPALPVVALEAPIHGLVLLRAVRDAIRRL